MKTKLIIFISTVLISLVITPLRSGIISIGVFEGFKLSSIVGFWIFFLLTYYVYNKRYFNKGKEVFIILLGLSIIGLPLRIFNFSGTFASHLEWLIQLIGAILGYVLYKIKNIYGRISIIIVSVCIAVGGSTWGYDLWINEMNHRTFTKPFSVLSPETSFITMQGDTVSLKELKGETLVLTFWSSSCGYCLEELPDIEKFYNQYKGRSDVRLYSVFCFRDKTEDYTSGLKIQKEEGVQLPLLSVDWQSKTVSDFEVHHVPAMFVIDKEGKIIYRGDLKFVSRFLDDYLNP